MKVLLFNGIDPNGQSQQLAHYIRTNTRHKAVNVVLNDTYLGYPADVLLNKGKEAKVMLGFPHAKDQDWDNFDLKKALDEFDFAVFRWIPCQTLYGLARQGLISADTCIVKFHGSEARYHPGEWRAFWEDTKITYVVNGYDYTLSRDLGYAVQHIPPMINCKAIWDIQLKTTMRGDGTFWIAHAPTDPNKKGTDYLLQAVQKLRDENCNIDVELIMKKSWKETIQLKAKCHALYDQMSTDVGIGTFGVNLIEGLAQSKICFGGYNKFTYSVFPELEMDDETAKGRWFSWPPVIKCTPKTLADQIRKVYKGGNWNVGYDLNKFGHQFVRERFDTNVVGRQWVNLIEFIAEGAAK